MNVTKNPVQVQFKMVNYCTNMRKIDKIYKQRLVMAVGVAFSYLMHIASIVLKGGHTQLLK